MYYYGNSYGYGNSGNCCGAQVPTCGSGCGFGGGYAIILVLFILLITLIFIINEEIVKTISFFRFLW